MGTARCRPGRGAPPPRRGRPGAAALCTAAALLALAGGYLWLLGGTAPPRPAAIGGPFELTASSGEAMTDRSFRGRYVLIYFGYTSCEDICPVTLSAVAEALDALGPKAARIQPLFVTVDPQRDTPEVLRRYVGGFSPRLIGLTGTPAEIGRMQREYHVTSVAHPSHTAGPMGYVVDHSSVLYLVGPDGRYLAPIRADATGAEMASDIAKHLS